MLFNSLEFISVFLPIVFIGYFVCNRLNYVRLAISWLVLASLFFYAWWNPAYLVLIISSMLFNYAIGQGMNRTLAWKKTLLIVGISGNLFLLGYYKYFDFFIANVNRVFQTNLPFIQVVLPLAISFFTFQQIAYLVDTYREETKQYNFMTYALFVTFFPQLIAGPIVHHKEMMPQFAALANKSIQLQNVVKGIFIFIIGLTKKVAIADTFAIWANDGFAQYEALTHAQAWLTSFAYTFQLYFDFSGYCDMAIGIALLFNITLPVNFYSPYKALTVQQFWRQWHITLGRFLTQYIYFPLGGSRVSSVKTYRNVFIIFFLSGLWHGAGWTFIIWGTLHGLAVMWNRFWGKYGRPLPVGFAWLFTFLFVNATWVFFRAESVQQAIVILRKMVTVDGASWQALFTENLPFVTTQTFTFIRWGLSEPVMYIGFLVIFGLLAFIGKNSIQLVESFRPTVGRLIWIQVMIGFVLLTVYYLHKNSEFLYFNF